MSGVFSWEPGVPDRQRSRGGAGDVRANGAFTVAAHRRSVGMLTLAAASTNMPAHATHVWKQVITTRMRQTSSDL